MRLKEQNLSNIDVRITRLPHGKDLPLPSYQSALCRRPRSARRGAGRRRSRSRPARARSFRPASPSRCPRHEGAGAAALRARRTHGLTVLNAPGTIDADYRGEIQVLLVNLGSEAVTITRGMRIAQLVIAPVARAHISEVASLDETARGSGGFGSTGS